MTDPDTNPLPRLAEDAELRRLKAATAEAVKLSGGSQFESRTRVRRAALSKYGARPGATTEPDAYMPLDVALELDRYNGAPLIAATLAGMLGYRLVPEAQAEAEELQLSDAAAIAKETGDVVNALLAVLTAGKEISAADRQAILKEITEAKQALWRLTGKIGG